MTKPIHSLTEELKALEEAKTQIEELISNNLNTDLAYYCDLGLQQCEIDIKEVTAALKVLKTIKP